MKFALIVSLYLLTVGNTYPEIPAFDLENSLQQCVTKIFEKIYEPRHLIFTVNVSFALEYPSINIDSHDDMNMSEFSRVNIYLVNVGDGFQQILDFLSSFRNFSPRARFLLIWNDFIDEEIFKIAADFYMSRMLVIEEPTQNMFTYFPYENQNVRKPNTKNVLIGHCSNISRKSIIFGKKMPKTWKNSKVRVAYKPWEPYVVDPNGTLKGIEIFSLETIKKYFGFQTKYYYNDGDYYDGKTPQTYYEAYGGVMNHQVDIALGALYLKNNEHLDFDVTQSYISDSFVWVVPRARVLKQYERIVLAFGPNTWTSIIASFVLFTIIYVSYLKCLRVEVPSKILFYFFGIFIEIAANVGSRYTVRKLLMWWIFYCLIVSTAFKSQMMNLLSGVNYAVQINSIQEIIDSDLVINLPQSYANLYDCEDCGIMDKYIYEHNLKCDNFVACINRTALERDTAGVAFGRYIYYRMSEFLDYNGKPMIHVLKEQIFLMNIHMIMSKGFPLFEQINKMLMLLQANGIIDYDFDFMENLVKVKYMSEVRRTEHVSSSNGLEMMALPFVLWGFGLGSSVGIFCLEMIWEKLNEMEDFTWYKRKVWGVWEKVWRGVKEVFWRNGKFSRIEDPIVMMVDGKIEVF